MKSWNLKRQKSLRAIFCIVIVASLHQLGVLFPTKEAYAETQSYQDYVDSDNYTYGPVSESWYNDNIIDTPSSTDYAPADNYIAPDNFVTYEPAQGFDYTQDYLPPQFFDNQAAWQAQAPPDYQGYIDSGNYTYGPVSETWYNDNVAQNQSFNINALATLADDWLTPSDDFGYAPELIDPGITSASNSWTYSRNFEPADFDVARSGGNLDSSLEFRETLAVATCGLIPLSTEQAAVKQARGEKIPWHERPWFSSELGLSDFNKGANYGSTVSGCLSNDLLHPDADKTKIVELNQGLIGFPHDQRKEYITQHAQEYKDAGAISVFAGGGLGEIVTNAELINNSFPDDARYYQKNLTSVNQSPSCIGDIHDSLLAMTLEPENYIKVKDYTDLSYIKNSVQPFFVKEGEATAGLIGKVGSHELYLTAEHCVDGLNLKRDSSITLGVYVPKDVLEGNIDPRLFELFKDVTSRQIAAQEKVAIEKIQTNPATDVAVFSVNRANSVAKVGESIQTIPIDVNDPKISDEIDFYRRPIWKNDRVIMEHWVPKGNSATEGYVQELKGPELKATDQIKNCDISNYDPSTLYKVDFDGLGLTSGWSGSPAFQPVYKSEGGERTAIAGMASKVYGDIYNDELFVTDSKNAYMIKPSVIRGSVEGFLQPTAIETEIIKDINR